MDDFKSNSYKYREEMRKSESVENQKVEKIVFGKVKTKKKSDIRKFTDIIISDDVTKVKEYVVLDVLIPAFKKAISDIITNGIDMILYGEAGRTKKTVGAASKVSYRNYNDVSNERSGHRPVTSRSTYSYDEIVLDNRGEAEAVIMQMDEIVNTYGFVKVADLYDLVGVTGSYTDNNYGWTDIRSARAERVKDGYLLKLPRALPID